MNDTSKIEHIYKSSSTKIIIKCKWKSTDRKKHPWREWTRVSDKKQYWLGVSSPKVVYLGKKERVATHCMQLLQAHCTVCQDGEVYIGEKKKVKERGS